MTQAYYIIKGFVSHAASKGAVTSKLKSETWDNIHEEFMDSGISKTQRTSKQLKDHRIHWFSKVKLKVRPAG